ncbi:MAG: hypothetical protein CBB87_06575 [Micavibrio sp. TMED27]|nr:phospholipid-binding domain-containing protein [Micavibrio sp.]OUT91673.1 MAG: hypothetical protein CBB87_06575 [Micavibrio sp. TMED27]|tara:strand:+ start:409 stop:1869 length:1461 start_codon:yes stop_codon:yes gene_type:complete
MRYDNKIIRVCLGSLCLLFAILVSFEIVGGFATQAHASKGKLMGVKGLRNSRAFVVTLGKAELMNIPGNAADVLVGNSSIVDVRAVQSNRLYLVGLQVGDTNLIALDAAGNVLKKIDIHVTYDLGAIQSLLDGLFPTEDVQVGAIHDQILLTGTVSNAAAAAKITNVVGHYVSDLQESQGTMDELIANLLEVRGGQQVMLQVKIVEATRNVLKELGIETFANSSLASQTSRGDQIQFLTGQGAALAQEPFGVLSGVLDTGLRGIGLLNFELNALEEENLVNILAEPNLTAVSGEQAGFLAGGEFPVPVGRDQVGNLVIEFREFGVSLNFRPTVLSEKRISLQLDTEVSSLDFDNAITLADTQVPGLDVRRADTTVEIASGGSLMIAGLLQSDAIENMAGLPGVRNTPVIGDLVSSEGFRREETELIVIVTPYLVQPYAEEKRSEPVRRVPKNFEMADAFVANIRRVYGFNDAELFSHDQPFGYILD